MDESYADAYFGRIAAKAPGFVSGGFAFSAIFQDITEWRDPDSNRGLHEFQSEQRCF
jgi:hypothetical protein